MNVGLRLFASQGWLERNNNIYNNHIEFKLTSNGNNTLQFTELYDKIISYYKISYEFKNLFINNNSNVNKQKIIDILDLADNNWGFGKHRVNSIEYQIIKHLNGVLIS